MARYIGAKCKLCRREGVKLFLKGDRCQSSKCAIERRNYAPGMHGKKRVKLSEYGLQLREKQKAKKYYGVIEKQFRNYFVKADAQPGITGENLLKLLEMRLDNVVYRAGYASSRTEARQIVRHNHILVNGKKVNIPSYMTKAGDVITLKEKSQDNARMKTLVEMAEGKMVPEWLSADKKKFEAKVVSQPRRDQIDTPIEETLIVELYSK